MIQLHPRSLLVGLALGGAVLFSLAQSVTKATPVTPLVRVEYMPHPRDMVQIEEGTPFTVPAGKVFVLTALGSTGPTGPSHTVFEVDGIAEVTAYTAALVASSMFIDGVPAGRTSPSGSVLTVANGSTLGRAWGYLADQ